MATVETKRKKWRSHVSDPDSGRWGAQVDTRIDQAAPERRHPKAPPARLHGALKFDPHRGAASAALKSRIADLAAHLEGLEGRRRQRTDRERQAFGMALEAVACGLILAEGIAPGTSLAVERGHPSLFGKGRYASPVFGRHFTALLDIMAREKLITSTKGFRVSERLSRPSTITAAPELWRHLPLGELGPEAIGRDENHEVLILKGKKGPTGIAPMIDYMDSAATSRMRRQVRELNERLKVAPLSLVSTIDSRGQPLDVTARSVTRVFNNGSWNEGGRLGGFPFWMAMSKEDRFRLLRIDGEQVACADYSASLIRFTYSAAKQPQPDGDPYDVRGGGGSRLFWKQLLLALLFVKPPGLRNWPRRCRAKFEGPGDPPRLRDAIIELEAKHAPIAHLFGTGIGFRSLRVEADTLLYAMEKMAGMGLPSLPAHDALWTARRDVEVAASCLQEAAQRYAGITIPIVHIDRGYGDLKD